MVDQVSPLQQLVLAPKVRDLFFDAQGQWIPSDYKVMHGGRAGMRTWGFARMAVMLAARKKLKPIRIACAREYQTSIAESVHEALSVQIEELELQPYFDVDKHLITAYDKSQFFFAGIKTEPGKFKSTEGIDVLWMEEGEKVSENSWQIISPTIRKDGSEIWCSFNPDLPEDPTSKRFIIDPIPHARIIETNWRDNPWLTDKLRREKDYLARVDADAYQHIWEGKFRQNSAAQIFANKWSVESFEPQKDWSGPYFGADWGFSQDPTALVKLWVHDHKLYIEYEAYEIGCEITDTPALFATVPGSNKEVIRADSARPETVSHLQRNGYPRCESCAKWTGCVEDGIAHMRSYEKIIIHPRCTYAAQEMRLYSYKVDKLSGNVMADVVDKHNHIVDACRYACQPLIKRRGSFFG